MGFFQKIIDGLKKTRDKIGFKLNELFKRGIFDEDFYEELEFILLEADIGEDTTVDIIDELRERMRRDSVSDSKRAYDYLREVMADILGDEKFETSYPTVIMVSGVNGVGKTTTIGKLANIFVKQGKSVVIAAADTFRAAASEQLEVWANRAKVRIIKHEEGSDPAAVVFDAISSAKSRGTDVVLVDTAGRLHNKKNLMEELRAPMADRLCITLVNNRVLQDKHFERQESGAVFLGEDGRKLFLSAWQTKKKEEITHPYLKEKMAWGLVPYVQSLLLARCLRGDLDGYLVKDGEETAAK